MRKKEVKRPSTQTNKYTHTHKTSVLCQSQQCALVLHPSRTSANQYFRVQVSWMEGCGQRNLWVPSGCPPHHFCISVSQVQDVACTTTNSTTSSVCSCTLGADLYEDSFTSVLEGRHLLDFENGTHLSFEERCRATTFSIVASVLWLGLAVVSGLLLAWMERERRLMFHRKRNRPREAIGLVLDTHFLNGSAASCIKGKTTTAGLGSRRSSSSECFPPPAATAAPPQRAIHLWRYLTQWLWEPQVQRNQNARVLCGLILDKQQPQQQQQQTSIVQHLFSFANANPVPVHLHQNISHANAPVALNGRPNRPAFGLRISRLFVILSLALTSLFALVRGLLMAIPNPPKTTYNRLFVSCSSLLFELMFSIV